MRPPPGQWQHAELSMLCSHMSLRTVHEWKQNCYEEVDVVAVCNFFNSVTEAAGTVSKKPAVVAISAHLWTMRKSTHHEFFSQRENIENMYIYRELESLNC